MVNMLRAKIRWSGFNGAPGYSIFHFRDFAAGGGEWAPSAADAQGAVDKLYAFAGAIVNLLPNGTILQVEGATEVINDSDNRLVDVVTVPNPLPRTSAAASASYSAASGAVINWRTSTIRRRRRVIGRTFLVPLNSAAYENNGTLSASTITTLSNAASALRDQAGVPDLGVYARPTRTKNPDGSVTTTNDGLWAACQSFNVPDMAAVMRSRRD